MTDVVTDELERSFDQVLEQDEVAALREEVRQLKERVERPSPFGSAQERSVRRPALSGAGAGARSAFVDGYLLRGVAVETKALVTAVDVDGGYAVPE